MQSGPKNLITDVSGLSVGNAQDGKLKSGVTVLIGDQPMVAGVHVMGGAPGTRETDLLAPDKTVQEINGLTLSGGSAFGLSAVDGVVDGLREDRQGFEVLGHIVPIVPGAILFDLANGGDKAWDQNPYPALGHAAYSARSDSFELGSVGAGAGATTADLKGGLGSASAILPSGATVGALVAVNALGQATVGNDQHFWSAPFEQADEFGGRGIGQTEPASYKTKFETAGSTTIAIVATDLKLDKATATRMAIAAHDGIARAIVPSHTPFDGDLVFACSTGIREPEDRDILMLGHAAATCLARAIARGVYEAETKDGDILPSWKNKFG